MIETVLRQYLINTLGASVPVFLEKPPKPPGTFVLIEKTGSSMSNRIETAIMAIQSYATTMYQAAVLNQQIKQAMAAAPDHLAPVAAAHLDSDYNYTDTASKHYRYQAVFDVTHYEV